MKKLAKFVFIIPFIVILGFVLFIIGSATSNSALQSIGKILFELVVPIVMLTLITVGLVSFIKSGTNIEKTEDEVDDLLSEAEKECEDIKEINESYGYEAKRKEAEYIAEHAAKNYKNASKKEKIFSFVFLGFLIGSIFLAIIFCFFRLYIGALICAGLFAGTIAVSAVIKTILEKTSIHADIATNTKDREILYGTITACLLSSAGTQVTYRVKITADNREYTAYCNEFYEEGSVVAFVVLRGRRASIVDAEKLEEYIRDRTSLLK